MFNFLLIALIFLACSLFIWHMARSSPRRQTRPRRKASPRKESPRQYLARAARLEKERVRYQRAVIEDRVSRKKFTITDAHHSQPVQSRKPSAEHLVRVTFPIVSHYSEVEPGEDYRLEGDGQDIIRVRPRKPSNATYPTIAIKGVAVAGISQPEASKNAAHFIAGINRSLTLVREPGNEYDKDAIKVIGSWAQRDKPSFFGSRQLGWVPREVAREIAKDKMFTGIELLATVRALFPPSSGGSPGIRMDIWI